MKVKSVRNACSVISNKFHKQYYALTRQNMQVQDQH